MPKPKLPKGAYRLPEGGYATEGPWTTVRKRKHSTNRIRIVGHHHDEPNLDKLVLALIGVARQQLAESEQSDTTAA